ncbi:MAG: hypothetical protein AAF548_03505 [Actinomycetota bacterium]
MSRRFLSVLFAAALLAACGDDGAETAVDDAPTGDYDTVIALDFEAGDLVGGSRQESVGLGDKVLVTASGDVGDEIHVHGYDLYIREGDNELEFDALIPGTFEVELEGSGRLLLRMTVS